MYLFWTKFSCTLLLHMCVNLKESLSQKCDINMIKRRQMYCHSVYITYDGQSNTPIPPISYFSLLNFWLPSFLQEIIASLLSWFAVKQKKHPQTNVYVICFVFHSFPIVTFRPAVSPTWTDPIQMLSIYGRPCDYACYRQSTITKWSLCSTINLLNVNTLQQKIGGGGGGGGGYC